MAKHESTVVIKFKADTTELLAALDEAEDRVEKLYAKLAKVRRGGPAAATRETR